MRPLGRVLDPDERDRAAGPAGRIAIDVPEAWLAAGDTVEVVVPSLVACARCDGGGCDGCGRSGAIRLEADEPARTFSLPLPRGRAAPIVLRLVSPLGEDAGLDQLRVELKSATAPAGCRRVEDRAPASRAAVTLIAVGLALVAALAALLLGR